MKKKNFLWSLGSNSPQCSPLSNKTFIIICLILMIVSLFFVKSYKSLTLVRAIKASVLIGPWLQHIKEWMLTLKDSELLTDKLKLQTLSVSQFLCFQYFGPVLSVHQVIFNRKSAVMSFVYSSECPSITEKLLYTLKVLLGSSPVSKFNPW